MSSLPPKLPDRVMRSEIARLTAKNAAMRKLIAKFGQGTFTLRHALTADEIQLMAECADMVISAYSLNGVRREMPHRWKNERLCVPWSEPTPQPMEEPQPTPTPQPDPKRHACGNVDGATEQPERRGEA